MKFEIFLVVTLAIVAGVLADTKVLHNVHIADGNLVRNEKISVNNADTPDEELVIDGSYSHRYEPVPGQNSPYTIVVIYVADKDGNRVKYTIQVAPPVLSLNPSTLKSLSG
uniref:Uncharacterized protein n=1 Tax=Stomoxys calcitrans TaxID=35570 RepID=A0A1I8PA08_STOCA